MARKFSISKIKVELTFRNVRDLIGTFALLVVSLIVIFSAQFFLEASLKTLANVATGLGSLMLSFVTLQIGQQFDFYKMRKIRQIENRKNEVESYKKYLEDVSRFISMLELIEDYKRKNQDYAAEKLTSRAIIELEKLREFIIPSNSITDSNFCERIKIAMNCLHEYYEKLEEGTIILIPNIQKAKEEAEQIIREYENLE